jgi:hypothetical protein
METPQLILDWSPFEQFTTDDANPWGLTTRITCKLELTQTGTRVILLMGKPRGTRLRVMLFIPIAKMVFVPQMAKAGEQLAQRIRQDLADGIVSVSPPIDVDKDQVASLATQALTADH